MVIAMAHDVCTSDAGRAVRSRLCMNTLLHPPHHIELIILLKQVFETYKTARLNSLHHDTARGFKPIPFHGATKPYHFPTEHQFTRDHPLYRVCRGYETPPRRLGALHQKLHQASLRSCISVHGNPSVPHFDRYWLRRSSQQDSRRIRGADLPSRRPWCSGGIH